jgi:hypothetical protein
MGPKTLLTLLLAVSALMPAQAVETACVEVDLLAGASRPAVRGVVERQLVASNPLPWGSSVAVVTRVWGAVTVERWAAGDEIRRCLMPVDLPVYEAVGISEVLVPVNGELSELERAALNSQFGPPAIFQPSTLDRTMAWFRVYPSVPFLVAAIAWAAVALLRRRRRRDPYLF